MSNKTAIFTSCAANYVPKARVLGSSVKQFHSDIDMFLLLVDELPPQLESLGYSEQGEARNGGGAERGSRPPHMKEPFDQIVLAKDLLIPDFERWLFKHRIVEACTAVKPFMLRYLLKQGYDQVFYFDPDIALFFPLTEILAEFDEASILLTPHQCKPETAEEAIVDNEICSLKHGLFNFGFVGVANDENGRAYAEWWSDRCHFACFEDIPNGVFTDQKWNDFTPIFFEGVKILKSPAYNVATWNYTQRNVQGSVEDGFSVDGQPLVFHHFTGYDSGAHHLMLDKYGKNMPATKALSEWYESACQYFAQSELAAVPWIYGTYDNGEAILPHHRKLYRNRKDLQDAFQHPFSLAPEEKYKTSFYHWLKMQHLWDAPSHDLSRPPRPFREFLQEAQAELCGYLSRTHKLAAWQKAIFLRMLNTGFWILGKITRKKKA